MKEERIDEIFNFIEESNIDLDEDPIRKGPKYLNKMVAETRNLSNHIQKYEREVAKEKLSFERALNKKEAEFELQKNDLMSNDPSVMNKSSVKDREAAVHNMLKDLVEEIQNIKNNLTDLGHVETVINSKIRELKDCNLGS